MTQRFLPLWLAMALLISAPARADDGHSHDAAPSAPSGPALPRFTAVSDLFELVGIVDVTRLTVYLDRFADNQPVQGARVELDVGGAKVALQEHEPGAFEGTLAAPLPPGLTAVTARIAAGAESDLLAGEVDVHEAAHEAPHTASSAQRFGPWLLGGALLTLALAWWDRRSGAVRRVRAGGAA